MYKKPHIRFFVFLAAFLAVFLAFAHGHAARAAGKGGFEGRYFVASRSALVRSLFGVQHEFTSGFTADLAAGEVWALEKLFRVNVVPVPLYRVSPIVGPDAAPASIVTEAVSILQDKESVKARVRSVFPVTPVPWGVKKIYSDETIRSTSGGKGVNVAILDTGVNVKHPDLSARIKDCKDFTRGPAPRSSCEDKNGHGTHVVGTVAADGGFDGKGIWGVASESNVLAYKVCRNDGTCWADDVAAALDYAVGSGANVVSISLGGDAESFILKNSIDVAVGNNTLIVAAAGNDGPERGSIDWPAAYAEVVAVGAVAEDNLVPDWSSRGVNDGDYVIEAREVEFGAPGVNVESAWFDGAYRYLSGTSMAAPHISGLAAKLWNGSATSTRAEVQKLARDIWLLGDDSTTGLGMPVLPKISSPVSGL